MSDAFHAGFPRVFSKYRPNRVSGSVQQHECSSTSTSLLSMVTLVPESKVVEPESKDREDPNAVWLDESQDWALACVRLRAQSIFPALDLSSLPPLLDAKYEVLCDRAQYELCGLVNDSLVALDTPGATIEDGDVLVVLVCSKICRAVEDMRKAYQSSLSNPQAATPMSAANTVYSLLSRLHSYPPTPTLPSREPLSPIDNFLTPPTSPKPPPVSPTKHQLVRIIPEVKNWRTEELVLSSPTIYGVPHSVQLEYLHTVRGPPSEIGRPASNSRLGRSYRQVTKLAFTLLGQPNEGRGFDFGALQPFPALRELELQYPLAVVDGVPVTIGCRCLEKLVLDMKRTPHMWTSHTVGPLLHHLAPKVLRCVRPLSADTSDLASTLLSRPKSARDISLSYNYGSNPGLWSLEVVYRQDGRVRVLEAVDAAFLKRVMDLKAIWATASSVTLPERVPECIVKGLLRQEMLSLREFVVVVGGSDLDRSLRSLAERGARLDVPPWQTKSCVLRIQDATGRSMASLGVLNGLCKLFRFPPETDLGGMRMKASGGLATNSLHSRIANHRHAYST